MLAVPWSTFSQLLSNAPIDFTYITTTSTYYIWTDSMLKLVCTLSRDEGSDVTDFETNYLSRGILFVYEVANKFLNITGNGTTVVKSGVGFLHSISINNNTTSGTVTLYNNTVGSGTVIMSIQVGSPSGGLLSTSGLPGPVHLVGMDSKFTTGLTIVTSGSSNNNITVFYR